MQVVVADTGPLNYLVQIDAIELLREMSLGFNEDSAYFQLTKLDGRTIRIFDGNVVLV